MITITDKAKEYLDQVRNDDYVTLRSRVVVVVDSHMSGISEQLADVQWSDPYADALVLDPMAEMFVGCTVDPVTELGGAYLKVINPNGLHLVVVVKVFQCRSYYDFARMY